MPNSRFIYLVSALAVIAVTMGLGGWYCVEAMQAEAREQLVSDELRPVAVMVRENESLVRQLQAAPFAEQNLDILGSYLAKIRRDGIQKHLDMKRSLERMAENNTAIATLLKAYAPHVKSDAFAAEAAKFNTYDASWRDRWNTLMELFMAGGNYVSPDAPFPKDFPAALEAELAGVNGDID